MSARDLIDGEADLDDEEEGNSSFDEETGESRRKTNGRANGGANGHLDDSSEEDEDDDDEEAARQVREGFIVEDEEEPEERARRKQERRKRRREEREEEEGGLDEEDLDLIGEVHPDFERRETSETKYKRLKRGHKSDREEERPRGVGDIFDDDDEEDTRGFNRAPTRNVEDEFADFIEEDFEDEGGRREDDDDDNEIRRKPLRNLLNVRDAAGLDEGAAEDMKEVFGNGYEYDWALEMQDQEELREKGGADPDDPDALSKGIELKDVFEPSQLVDRMLTDEDNRIRVTDQPERFQIARKPYRDLELTEAELNEESFFIARLMIPRKHLEDDLREPFHKAVAKVLEFMNVDEYEVPFIFQHRKDYLIHARRVQIPPDPNNPNGPEYKVSAEKLLTQSDLWEVFEHDLKFRGLIEKRHALQKTYENLVSMGEDWSDPIIEEMLQFAQTMEELQDVQDYMYFQHSSRLADLAVLNNVGAHGNQRRPGATRMLFDKIRNSKVYGLVRAFGITADAFAQNASKKDARRQYAEDPTERPDDMADSEAILDPPDYPSGAQCLRAAKAMFAEEIAMSPRMRKTIRQEYFLNAMIDCVRTEKGLRKIDEQHPYYEIKYLRNQTLSDIAQEPARFLRMLKAEDEGLVEVKVRMETYPQFKKSLCKDLESDNFSEVADAWNRERRETLDMALAKLDRLLAKELKGAMKTECENQVAKECREEYQRRLDQAPFKPKGMVLGTVPRVITLSNGNGTFGKDAICWAHVDDYGRVHENGKFVDLAVGDQERNTEDGKDVAAFVELVQRRHPDVIGVSGFTAETRKLFRQLEDIIERKDLRTAEFDDENGDTISDRLEVVMINDEVARLYQTSERANMEHPGFAPLTKYCVALANYLQNPMKEYASLGRDIISIVFNPDQQYVPQDKLMKNLETAMVDMVNLCGVDINAAVDNMYTANLLPYVCGLGPRKATQLVKVININGGIVNTRAELVGDPDNGKLAAVGGKVFNNCASFLYVEYDPTEPEADYLDHTRVHPEDYELGRKMAADALELDEEDIQAEVQENGPGAIVRKLIKDEAQEKVNDLILEEYAEQLEKNFNQRKRATLETIRAELQVPYEELRRNFSLLSTDEIFTMLTGETKDSLCENMIVPVSIKKVADDYVECKMDCGIEGTVPALAVSTRGDISARQLFSLHQTVQAKITYLNRKHLTANFSLREDDLQKPYKKEVDHSRSEWDEDQERKDKEAMREKNEVSGRTQRVIKHPLFKPFNSTQAEEYLGSQGRGDLVIRPSSKGPDHLAVTWKISDNIYQHIDVLELDKSSTAGTGTGTTLKIGGKYTYSDLDELIVNHVKAMAKQVDHMMDNEKYRNGSRAEIGK